MHTKPIILETRQEAVEPISYHDKTQFLFDEKLRLDFESIPDKLAFKIGDVAKLTGIKAYVLRYWESEFKTLKPKKSPKNQRFYTRRDVEMVFIIKKLLYRDCYSIQGAIEVLKKYSRMGKQNFETRSLQGHREHLIKRLERVHDKLELLKEKMTV